MFLTRVKFDSLPIFYIVSSWKVLLCCYVVYNFMSASPTAPTGSTLDPLNIFINSLIDAWHVVLNVLNMTSG